MAWVRAEILWRWAMRTGTAVPSTGFASPVSQDSRRHLSRTERPASKQRNQVLPLRSPHLGHKAASERWKGASAPDRGGSHPIRGQATLAAVLLMIPGERAAAEIRRDTKDDFVCCRLHCKFSREADASFCRGCNGQDSFGYVTTRSQEQAEKETEAGSRSKRIA